MQTSLYGATGRAGSRILAELILRGHAVTAVTRDINAKPPERKGIDWTCDDLSDVEHIRKTIAGAQAVVSAYAAPPDAPGELKRVCLRLAEAVTVTNSRLIIVGGAGVLQVVPGVTLLQSGRLPPEWRPLAQAHADALAALRATAANWTYISPAALFDPGERTGDYRISENTLLMDASGQSRISMEDYAIAVVDEIETPRHIRSSFAVAW
jgi:putative NADH-flavin reductase